MNIVVVAWRDLAHPNAGGSERYVDDVASGLTVRNHHVALLAGGPVGRRRYSVVDTGSTFGQYLRAPFWYLRHGRASTDLVVDVQNGLPFWAPLWHRGPVVCVVHHVHTDQWATRFPRPLAAIGRGIETSVFPKVYRRALFVAVSPSTAQALVDIGVDRRQIRIVPNAVHEAPEPLPEHAEPRFVVLGRLVPHKRVDLALAVWERVRPVTGGRLVVIGDGPDRARLQDLAGSAVDFLGTVDEATKYRRLSEAWLLLHPAMHEGWGVVITEAGRQRTPALGFDVPGVRDAIVNGETGVLVEDLLGFEHEWVALAADRQRRLRLGEAARRHAAAFDLDGIVDRFEAVCNEALLASPERPR